MNDRFKFRVWDKAENMYHYDAECAYDYMGGTPPLMDVSFGDVLCNDDYVIEQCTGLTDKNGKLIYEGDVVDFNGEYSGKVLFKNGCFVWDWGFNDPPIYGLDKEYIEIIGNIHDDQFREVTKMMEAKPCQG